MRLDGLRILDLTHLLPGPYATQLLADAGADVVKIEDVDTGDSGRHMPPITERGGGAIFESVNRGKRSVALNLKSERGQDAFYTLVREADVVFEQFRPGVVDRLGIDYETVRKYNDEIIYCSLSGYGQTGPYTNRAGHDLNYIATSGLLDMTRDGEDRPPQIPGYQIADLGGGLFAAFAIVSALLSQRLGNTTSEYIDVAMADVVLSFSQAIAYQALNGEPPRPGETALTGRFPCYNVYECSDGEYITLAALEPKFWESFCTEVNRSDLIDKHMAAESATREALRQELQEIFAQQRLDEWMDKLSSETMTAPVNTLADAVEHPLFEARNIVKRPDDAPPRIGSPISSSDRTDEDVPGHGEHTEEVLQGVGVSEESLTELRDANIIK